MSEENILCKDIPFYDLYSNTIKEQLFNMYSMEYFLTLFLAIIKIYGYTCKEQEKKYNEAVFRKEILETITKKYKKYSSMVINISRKIINEAKESLCSLGFSVREVGVELLSRGLVNTASGFGRLLFEVGLAIDPYTNIPYIPASTIKGAVRSATYEVCLKNKGKDECRKAVDKLFGSTDEGVGLIGFTDAYPIDLNNKYLVVPDVMTPHYNRETLRYEYEVEPVPITFLALNKGVRFKFLMYYRGIRGGRTIDYEEDLVEDPDNVVKADDLKLLDKAILLSLAQGIGAKTSIGYTRFKVLSYKNSCTRR